MLRYFFTIILSFLFIKAFSQERTIDSLKKVFNGNSEDTTRLKALNHLLSVVPPVEREFYNNQMIEFAKKRLDQTKQASALKKKYLSYVSEGYYYKGVFLANRNQPDSAILCFDKCITLNNGAETEIMAANSQVSKAIIYTTRGAYNMAANLLYKALKCFEAKHDDEGAGYAYMQIAKLYNYQKNTAKAILFLEKAYTSYEKANYQIGMVDALYKLAKINLKNEDHKKSVEYIQKCIELSKKLGLKDQSSEQEMVLNNGLGILFLQKKDYTKALYHFKKTAVVAENSNNSHILASHYLQIANVYYKLKKYSDGLIYANKAMDFSLKTKNIVNQMNTAELLWHIHKSTNNFKSALQFYETYKNLSDSLQKANDKKQLIEQQVKYEFEKKELLLASAHELKINNLTNYIERNNRQKNTWLIIIISCSLIFVLISYFLYKHQKQKNIIEIQKSNLLRQKMMLSQMNPHFIFNAINSIQNYILKNKEEAYGYLVKFSKLIRMVLNNSREDVLTLSNEIETLKLYVELEQLRFNNSFEFKISMNEDVDPFNIEIPTMLMQPYVENAIWHGLMNLKDERKGILNIDIAIDDKILKIIIEDNGIGRVLSNKYKTDNLHHSVGMKLTEQRIEMINELKNAGDLKVTITDLYDNKQIARGTKVELFLPLT